MRLDHLLSMENVRRLLSEVSSYNRRQNQKDGRDEIQSEGFRTSDLVVRLSVTARAEAGAEKQPWKRSRPARTLN